MLWGILIRLVTGARGSTSRRSWSAGCRTRRCGPAATSGSLPGSSRRSRPKRSPRSTGSWASIWGGQPRRVTAQGPLRGRRNGAEPHRSGQAGLEMVGGLRTSRGAHRRVIDGANRSDIRMLIPTIEAVAEVGLLADIDTLHLDRGYDYPVIRQRLGAFGLDDLDVQRRGTKQPGTKQPITLGLRWIVEATNSWCSNYGQLRRNTDRRNRHRHAALCLATTVLIVGKLIDHRDRWSPK